jgi:hypothetical protein
MKIYSVQYTNSIYEFSNWIDTYIFGCVVNVLSGGRVFYNSTFVSDIHHSTDLTVNNPVCGTYTKDELSTLEDVTSGTVLVGDLDLFFPKINFWGYSSDTHIVFMSGEFGSYAIAFCADKLNLVSRAIKAVQLNERKVTIDAKLRFVNEASVLMEFL